MSNLNRVVSRSVASTRTPEGTSMIASVTTRTGGPRHSNRRTQRYERTEMQRDVFVHAPLDIDMHWTWTNPINVIPATLLVMSLIALISSLMYL